MVRRPYPTYLDQSYPSTELVWRAIRELRAAPPGYAGSGRRQKVFSAALEQAEQLFKAASAVEPSSRPILLFYGLSQAGRALAACAPIPPDSYELQGHGIVASNVDQTNLGEVTIRDKGAGQSFTRIADIVGSRSLPSDARIADLWSSILEMRHWPLKAGSKQAASLTLEKTTPEAGTMIAVINGMPRAFYEIPDEKERELKVTAWLSDYSALSGYSFLRPGVFPADNPESCDERQGTVGCRLRWRVEKTESAQQEKFEEIAPWKGRSQADGTRWLHASFGGDDRQMHPLLIWWAVLYGLSMLARYQPGQWTAQIDVNRSRDAVPVEYLLDTALSTVPELVLATIDDVCSTSADGT